MTTTSMLPDVGIELREGYAEVGDVNLHYVEAGDGPLVVLLHGFPEFWFGWRLQIAPLAAAGFRRGRARHAWLQPVVEARRPRGLRPSTCWPPTSAISSANAAPSPALLVGHDWGGTVAWAAAMNHPEVGGPSGHPQRGPSAASSRGTAPPEPAPRSWYFFYFALPEAARAPCAREGLARSSEHFLHDAQPPYSQRGDRSLHRGVVAARRSGRDDRLLPRRGATAEGRQDGAPADLGADPGHLGREAIATSARISPSPTTRTCPTSTASSACPTRRTGSTTTSPSASHQLLIDFFAPARPT